MLSEDLLVPVGPPPARPRRLYRAWARRPWWAGSIVASVLLLALVSWFLVPKLGGGPALVETFNGDHLDRDRWSTCYYFRAADCTNEYNQELQVYRQANVTVGGGALHLTARRERAQGFLQSGEAREFGYTSGMVSSHGNVSFTYGYVEFRARLAKGKGLWPALWLLPEGHRWPPEVDVMEYIGEQPDRVYMTNHPGDGSDATSFAYVGPDFSQDWHTFAVDWQPGSLTYYVDGQVRGVIDKGVPSQPMDVVMNLAVGGSWPGSPDASTSFPATMDVDSVRMLDRAPERDGG